MGHHDNSGFLIALAALAMTADAARGGSYQLAGWRDHVDFSVGSRLQRLSWESAFRIGLNLLLGAFTKKSTTSTPQDPE